MSYKFIIDTSAASDFGQVEVDIINRLCQDGTCSFYLTQTLLEERSSFITKPKSEWPNTAVQSLKFIGELKIQRTFKQLAGNEGILTNELEGRANGRYFFEPIEATKEIQRKLLGLTEEIIPEDVIREIIDFRSTWATEKQLNKERFKAARCEILSDMKKEGQQVKNSTFEGVCQNLFEKQAISIINKEINSTKPKQELIKYWQNNRALCPYFNAVVRLKVYTRWHHCDGSARIDKNEADDRHHLTYLTGLDGIISHETKESSFMKMACKAVFPDKDYLSVTEFIKKFSN